MTPTDRATTPNESAQLEQLSERMQGLAIQTSVFDKVDVTLWGQDIKPDEEDEIAVTTYAARFMSNAQFERLEGDDILDHFQQHFEGWNQDIWNRPIRQPTTSSTPNSSNPPKTPHLNLHTQYMFMKLWDKDQNYTGEPYDLLDEKLRIFMSICYNIQVKPSQFHALFPRILAGRAQTFYIDKIEWTTTFRKAYDSIKQHFDTEVNHVHYYTDWTTTTFNSIRAQDASKSLHEVLQLLFDKLQLCQRALGPDYAGNIPLRTTLIIACRGVPELEHALFKPAAKIETSLQIYDLPLRPTLPDRQTLSICKALTDHLDQRIRTISTTSIADTITTAYEEDTDTQDNDPIADMDKATTVEATGPQAIATTPLATPIAIGPKSALFVDKKVAGQPNTLQKNDKRPRTNMSHIVNSQAYNLQTS
ncbi:hypothetical protein HRG_012906 [Hirsutella rhossiliensis]